MDIQEAIIDIIAEKIDRERGSIQMSDKFKEDFGADSIARMEFILDLEDKFDISISYEDAENWVCVQDAVDYVKTLKGA